MSIKMEERQSILHELYVFSEWKPEPEYLQKSDNILPEHLSSLWRWLIFFGPKKSLIDSVSLYKERQLKWHIALGDEGKVIAVLTDNILEIRTKRSEYATIAARTTVSRDAYSQWRKVVWSPDCSFVAVAYGNGVVSFFDLTASNLFNIPIDCNRPGGLECTDNTHAVADILFMPLRVKDNKWNWEVLIVTYDGKLRGFLVSQTDGFKLHHSFRFAGGVAACAYSAAHSLLLVAGFPRGKDPSSPLHSGLTAWRILNDDPFYKLSVACDQLEAQMATERFQLYVPFISSANMAFIINMAISPDGTKMVCIHCTGEISVWRLPVLKMLQRWPLTSQPEYDAKNPLVQLAKEKEMYYPVDVNWWTNEEIIVSRVSGAVTVCNIVDMCNMLGAHAQFLQGAPRVTRAHHSSFMALECESNTLPGRPRSETHNTEITKLDKTDDTMYEVTKELFKSVLYAITDIETFQPKPKKITVVSRIYRLLGIKSTTPEELFSRNIESGHYADALKLAKRFNLDSDLVYQQQWRKTPVSTDAIQNYLSKVSKKIWAVHQCVDRLPETLPAAKELLQFGLKLTNKEILQEINKDRTEENYIDDPDKITLEDLNAYSSELLRCRHVMLFFRERLRLYEAILRCEKSTYVKDEYDRLRSNTIVHSATELAKEGRISALTCLWPHITFSPMKMSILDNVPETIDPYEYKSLLETIVKINFPPVQDLESDWCKKEIFRTIWSNWSNWSEEQTHDKEKELLKLGFQPISSWYLKRAREIEARCGIISHALNIVTLGHNQGISGLDVVMYNFKTLDTLVYDLNLEGITLDQVHKWSALETCKHLMTLKSPETFLTDLKTYVVPYLKRYEQLINQPGTCIQGLTDYLESLSIEDLSWILLVLQSPNEFELDMRTHLDIAEQCLMAHNTTEQLDKACDVLDTILKKENDGSISPSELVRRVKELERLLSICRVVWWRGVNMPLSELKKLPTNKEAAKMTLTRIARSLALTEKPTPQDWEKLLRDIMLLQLDVCSNVTIEQCYEIYSSSLLTSGDAASIKLAAQVLTCNAVEMRRGKQHLVPYDRSIALVLNAAKEYFNSAMSLTDPSLDLAKCCLTLVNDGNPQIQEELDLYASLQILSGFNLNILPIQVRLCEDKMTLINDCLKFEPSGYLASHKLLKLAKLLRVAGDDEQKREGQVLHLIGSTAMKAGPAGAAAAADAARKLATLRYKPAADLLTTIATHAQGHLDRNTRKELFAAAVTHCDPHSIDGILKSRLSLEVESLQQMDSNLRVQGNLKHMGPSMDDEFADAITTPVVERKDLVDASSDEAKAPLFHYLMETWQNKSTSSDPKPSEKTDKGIHCQEFYRTLYPGHKISTQHYSYDCFSLPEAAVDGQSVGQSVVKWFFPKSTIGDEESTGDVSEPECGAIQKCAEELLYKDTPLSVCCMMRSSQYPEMIKKFVETHNTDSAVSAALYAILIKCNSPDLRDNAYLARPLKMVRTTLKHHNASPDQLELIRACLDKLMTMVELNKMKTSGCPVNGPLFVADPEYRQEVVYRMARSSDKDQFELACKLAKKYDISTLELWIQYVTAVSNDSANVKEIIDMMPTDINKQEAIKCLKSGFWQSIRGDDHNALINYYTIIKSLDEKTTYNGLTAAEHIKLLKKAKAASSELNYRLLLEQASAEEFTAHILQIIKPDNVGLLTKFLRTLPPSFKIPVSVNTLYTLWLTKYFFSVSSTSATTKKWMKQYRQCASYFNKLTKDDLLEFVTNTCFSVEAVERVPAGTRNLMIMQAVDYCQQEQENDLKLNKTEATWGQIGQELTRWARFLENYHSTTIQGIKENNIPRDELWIAIERSHGDMEKLRSPLCRLLLESDIKPASLSTLLQCLNIPTDIEKIFTNALDIYTDNAFAMQTLVTKLTYYHKEGVHFSEDLLDTVMQMATVHGLPPHKLIGLLSLSQKNQIQDGDDWLKVVQFTLELFKVEWDDTDEARQLTDQNLLDDESRRETFLKFLKMADTWQRKKALVDVLNCWPPSRNSKQRSLQCDYIQSLLPSSNHKESLVLIKLLLRKPVLVEEEIEWLANNAPGDAIINLVWVILLSKCEHSREKIPKLVKQRKEIIEKVDIEDDLVKELLHSGLFIKIVSTPLYSPVINCILSMESSNLEPPNVYTVKWAINELLRANFIGEAGHLKLLALGVPNPLRNFSQSVLSVKKMFSK